jgi:hypothetical protein
MKGCSDTPIHWESERIAIPAIFIALIVTDASSKGAWDIMRGPRATVRIRRRVGAVLWAVLWKMRIFLAYNVLRV